MCWGEGMQLHRPLLNRPTFKQSGLHREWKPCLASIIATSGAQHCTELQRAVQVGRVHRYLAQALSMLQPRHSSPPPVITMLLFARPSLLQVAV